MSKATRITQDPPKVLREIADAIDGRPVESELADEEGKVSWPTTGGGKPVEFMPGRLAEEIMLDLIGRIPRFADLVDTTIAVLYRNKKWEKNGKVVHGEMKIASGLLGFFSDADFVLQVNWGVWLVSNPWQRVALIYHELRHAQIADGKAVIEPHEAEVFFDELELFGLDTYRDWALLGEAVQEGALTTVQYHLEMPVEEEADEAEEYEDATDTEPATAGV